MKVLIFLALIGLISAQQQFSGRVLIRNDPNVIGTISANVNYDFAANRTRFDYTNIGGGISEFFEFGALVSVRYLVCSGSCQAETIKTPILRLFQEAGDSAQGTVVVTDDKGASKTCNVFRKANVPAGGVSTIAINQGATTLCQATFANGKRMDFFNTVNNLANAGVFTARPANCPQPQCTKKQDIVLVFDESGSIDSASFQKERQFGIDFARSFTFSPNAVQMGLVQFDTTARLTITLTADQASFINQMSVISQNRGATCIGCGISRGQTELFSARGRSAASKTLVVLTDGQNNQQVGAFPGVLSTAKGAGITLAAIGVAQAVVAEINNIASNTGLAFFATDFNALNGVLTGLTSATCDDIAGNPCGTGCKGFCACKATCLCPDLCETNSKCTNPLCNAAQNGAGCQFPNNVVCNDGNACTTDSCNPATGCVATPFTCNDNKFCTIDSCNPAVGCVFQARDCNPVPPDPCRNFTCSEANQCSFVPVNCDLCTVKNVTCADVKCQVNVCDPKDGLCKQTPKVCNSNNKCIIDSCDSKTGNCVQTAVVCNDNNACTDDTCNIATGCVFTPIDVKTRCDDSSVCTIDTCNPAVGCVHTPITCNVTNICRTSVCNSLNGCQESDVDCGAVLSVIDPNKQGNCYVAACDPAKPNKASKGKDGCFLSQIAGTTVDKCGFCAAPGSQSPFCFLGLSAPATAGLGAGAIAAIVIAAVVAAVVAVVSGKKGYDVWLKHRNNMQGAQANPMYEDSGRSGNNPFFEAKA